ncbi:MAG: hypothetical protein NT040_04905 [Bacteroidetes bacterium]|nr:hypothetical protein [Bacteroidota bacterium]
MRKAFVVLVILAIINLGGCCSYDCNKVPTHFSVNGLMANLMQITGVYDEGNIALAPLDSLAHIDFDKFVIQLSPQMTFYGGNMNVGKACFFNNAAVACKCQEPGYAGTFDQISEINVFSAFPFASPGATSDTLSRFFDIDGFQSNGSYLKRIDLVSFAKSNPLALRFIRLMPKVKPGGSLTQKFYIVYKQTNGAVFSMTTPTIVFNP